MEDVTSRGSAVVAKVVAAEVVAVAVVAKVVEGVVSS